MLIFRYPLDHTQQSYANDHRDQSVLYLSCQSNHIRSSSCGNDNCDTNLVVVPDRRKHLFRTRSVRFWPTRCDRIPSPLGDHTMCRECRDGTLAAEHIPIACNGITCEPDHWQSEIDRMSVVFVSGRLDDDDNSRLSLLCCCMIGTNRLATTALLTVVRRAAVLRLEVVFRGVDTVQTSATCRQKRGRRVHPGTQLFNRYAV